MKVLFFASTLLVACMSHRVRRDIQGHTLQQGDALGEDAGAGKTAVRVCPAIQEPPKVSPYEQCEGYRVHREFAIEDVLPSNLPEGELPPVEIGTDSNMCMHPDVDYGGIWWMSSHEDLKWGGKSGGNKLNEYLVSFAGAVVNSTTSFPFEMTAPTNYARHWTWGNSESGRFLMNYYSQNNKISDHQRVNFFNSTFAEFTPVAEVLRSRTMYLITKKSEDEWVRLNYAPMDNQTMEEAEYIYTLVRIVKPDGSPTKFWDKYLEYMRDKKNFVSPFWGMTEMLAWNSNDDCMRKCELGYLTRWMPCRFCAWKCR